MPKPSFLQTILGRPSQSYHAPSAPPAVKNYHSAKKELLEAARRGSASVREMDEGDEGDNYRRGHGRGDDGGDVSETRAGEGGGTLSVGRAKLAGRRRPT